MLLMLLQTTSADYEELLDIFQELIRSVDGDENACDTLCYLLDNYNGSNGPAYFICAQVVRDKIIVYLSSDAGADGYPRGTVYAKELFEINWIRKMLKEI